MESLQYYLRNGGLEEAREEAISDIACVIDDLPTNSQLEIISEFTTFDVHDMCDLDEVYYGWDIRDVLTDLRDIDPYDDFFEANDHQSGNDPFELAYVDVYKLAKEIFEEQWRGYTGIGNVLDEYKAIKRGLENAEKKREIAQYLVDTADITELDEIITLLWSRKEM